MKSSRKIIKIEREKKLRKWDFFPFQTFGKTPPTRMSVHQGLFFSEGASGLHLSRRASGWAAPSPPWGPQGLPPAPCGRQRAAPRSLRPQAMPSAGAGWGRAGETAGGASSGVSELRSEACAFSPAPLPPAPALPQSSCLFIYNLYSACFQESSKALAEKLLPKAPLCSRQPWAQSLRTRPPGSQVPRPSLVPPDPGLAHPPCPGQLAGVVPEAGVPSPHLGTSTFLHCAFSGPEGRAPGLVCTPLLPLGCLSASVSQCLLFLPAPPRPGPAQALRGVAESDCGGR